MFSHASTRQNPANRPLIQQAVVTLWLTAVAVSIAAPALAQEPRISTLSPKQQEALAFRCVHQQLPAPTPEADQLFLYARYLQNTIWSSATQRSIIRCGCSTALPPPMVTSRPISICKMG